MHHWKSTMKHQINDAFRRAIVLHKDFPLTTTAAPTPAFQNIVCSLDCFGQGPQLTGQCPCLALEWVKTLSVPCQRDTAPWFLKVDNGSGVQILITRCEIRRLTADQLSLPAVVLHRNKWARLQKCGDLACERCVVWKWHTSWNYEFSAGKRLGQEILYVFSNSAGQPGL